MKCLIVVVAILLVVESKPWWGGGVGLEQITPASANLVHIANVVKASGITTPANLKKGHDVKEAVTDFSGVSESSNVSFVSTEATDTFNTTLTDLISTTFESTSSVFLDTTGSSTEESTAPTTEVSTMRSNASTTLMYNETEPSASDEALDQMFEDDFFKDDDLWGSVNSTEASTSAWSVTTPSPSPSSSTNSTLTSTSVPTTEAEPSPAPKSSGSPSSFSGVTSVLLFLCLSGGLLFRV